MKRFTILFLLISSLCLAQDLTITSGNSLTIENGVQLYLNGIELEPNADYELIGPNTISKSATPIDGQSINRVYNLSNPLLNYQGNLIFSYEDSELNSITESDLVLVIKDVSNTWNPVGSSLNETSNILDYTFTSPTDIYGTSASDNTTLNLSSFENIALQIYPNPVESRVIINYKNPIKIEVNDELGRLVFKTKNKSIDVSNLNNGVYLLQITDLKMNKKTIRKIIKK